MIFLPPLGIKDKAKFSIAFVLKISVVFFCIERSSLFTTKLDIYRNMSKNVKIAFNFLLYFIVSKNIGFFMSLNKAVYDIQNATYKFFVKQMSEK